jgi:hypothetical protein
VWLASSFCVCSLVLVPLNGETIDVKCQYGPVESVMTI